MTGGSGLSRWLEAGCTSVKYAGAFPEGEPIDASRIVGRVLTQDAFRPFVDTPEVMAAAYVGAELLPAIIANPHITTWEVLNEPDWKDDEHPERTPFVMEWVCQFIYHVTRLLHSERITCVIGNWSVGNPDYVAWNYSEWFLRAVKDFGAIVGRHCYGPLELDYAYRYEKDAQIFSQLGYPDVKFYLTEVGADNVREFKPWKDYYGNTAEGFDRYWSEWIVPFEKRIRNDPCVLGAHLYTLGTGGADAWLPFDVSETDIAERMVRLSAELGEIPTASPTGDDDVSQIIAQTHFFERDTPPSVMDYLTLVFRAGDWFNTHQTMDGFTYPARDIGWWEFVKPGMQVQAGIPLPVYAVPDVSKPFLNADGTPRVYRDGRRLTVTYPAGEWFLVWFDVASQRGMWARAADCTGVIVPQGGISLPG